MSSRVCAVCVLALACSAQSVEPRPQRLVFVDTNALVLGELARDPELAGSVAVDTLRIDRLDEAGEPVETQELVVPEPRDWPVSFGVVGPKRQWFRLRAFRADNAHASQSGPLLPVANLAIDRLIQVEPSADFQRLLVVLDASCFNAPPSFSGAWASCLDAEHTLAPPLSGVDAIEATPASVVNSTALARPIPCTSEAPPGTACIPGGAAVLGDEDAALLALGPGERPSPPHVISLAPFFLDLTELTVGRYRQLLQGSKLTRRAPLTPDPADRDAAYCTFLGAGSARNDDLPLNCVSYEAARELCQALGGDLPTDAQWEYAARGRGWGRQYPWGSQPAECCTASLSRPISSNRAVACRGAGIEPVASHQPSAACAASDISRDGVLDLGGSLQEWTLDAFRPYDHPCWTARGVLLDPVCQDASTPARGERGSYFNAGLASARAVRRSAGTLGSSVGLRCAYPGGAVE